MKKHLYKVLFCFLLPLQLVLFSSFVFDTEPRSVHLAGLVVDAKSLQPVDKASIFDNNQKLLGTTDENGFYDIMIPVSQSGPVHFKISIRKNGYQAFSDAENWSDLQGTTETILYYGLQNKNNGGAAFSSFANGAKKSSGLNYETVKQSYEPVMKQRQFENNLAEKKKGNEDVFMQLDEKFFIVDDGGWIQIHSDKDMISINEKQVVAASQLNEVVKRKNIKAMTPTESNEVPFAIKTK